MIKLKCVSHAVGWDNPYIYFLNYFTININPLHIESVSESSWELCKNKVSTETTKGLFGRNKVKEVHTAVPFNVGKTLYIIRTASGEVYRTYEEVLLIKEGLVL